MCFGSQTGTAEQYAKTIMEEARGHGYDATVLDLEDFDGESLGDAPLMLFAMATYGEGEPTDNAHGFVRWLKSTEVDMSSQEYAVFGLGNTQYEHFNAVGKLTDKLMAKLGANRVLDVSLGDDDRDLDADFDAWRKTLWKKLVGNGPAIVPSPSLETAFDVVLETTDKARFAEVAGKAAALDASEAAASTRFYFTATRLKVTESRELRSPLDDGSTRHVELSAPRAGFFATADNVAILPENDRDDVRTVAKCLGIQEDPKNVRIALDGKSASHPFPTPCTLETALARYCDLTHKPKQRQLDALAEFCIGKQCGGQPETLIDALVEIGPLKYSDRLLSVFFDKIAPRLQPRYYTISSSATEKSIHVTSSLVALPNGRPGVCTRYIDGLREGATVAAFVRPSSFRPPPPSEEKSRPLILIGPGTGVAPARAVVRDIIAGAWRPKPSKVTLFFGCKKPHLDHLYKSEMEGWVEDSVIDLKVAYSRIHENKVYVQHLIKENATEVANDILDNQATVFVCGATAMGSAVHAAIREALYTRLEDGKEADRTIDAMKQTGRYVQELWA